MSRFRRSDRYKNDGSSYHTGKYEPGLCYNGDTIMRMNPSTTLSALNGARTLWKWLRRPSNEASRPHAEVDVGEIEQRRRDLDLRHREALNRLRADARQQRMESAMGLFATVQQNKRLRASHAQCTEGLPDDEEAA